MKTISELNISRWLRWGYAIILGITLNFILDVIFSLVYSQYRLFQPITNYINAILLTFIVGEALFFVNKKLNKSRPWETKPVSRFVTQLFSSILITNIIVFVIRIPMLFITYVDGFIQLYNEFIIIGFLSSVSIFYTIIDMLIFLVRKWQSNMAELERFKKENTEYKFELLRSQLNPHFLFNSLSTLSSLVYENQEKAGSFIRELSDVYRYILENRDKDVVTLQKEMSFAGSYIRLNKLRFDENISINTAETNSDINKKKIAPLTIQLLLENAIKHNVISKKKPLKVDITFENSYIIVKNKKQLKRNREYSSNMGLKNINNRYSFLTESPVEVIDNNDEFVVKIPLI